MSGIIVQKPACAPDSQYWPVSGQLHQAPEPFKAGNPTVPVNPHHLLTQLRLMASSTEGVMRFKMTGAAGFKPKFSFHKRLHCESKTGSTLADRGHVACILTPTIDERPSHWAVAL
jgi:hypothetical protein